MVATVITPVCLKSHDAYGGRPPAIPIGELIRLIPDILSRSIRMAFMGRSTVRGSTPNWLRSMSDIRFTDLQGSKDETKLFFECPTLGSAAPQLYAQQEFEWTERPSADDCGFDLYGDVITAVRSQDRDSDRFDMQLLKRVGLLQRGINGTFQQLEFTSRRYPADCPVVLDERTIQIARDFTSRIPKSDQVRVVGKLDMLRASTQSFAIKTDDGSEVRGILPEGCLENAKELLAHRVLIIGQAAYRPSGRLLRVDAIEIQEASKEGAFFSRVPQPKTARSNIGQIVRDQSHKKGLAAIIGKWPGQETDDEIALALQEMD
ncbi:MAG: hypothetical protein SGI77_25430 [Pirellulaceae bacterium]|nr:hypothetical protein [Pirellulaceae bacterium]